MANATYGHIIYADTVGILSKTPLYIDWINFYPNAVTDAFDLNFWDEANPISGGDTFFNATASSGTVTDTDTDHDVMTSTAFPDGGVVLVQETTGAVANKTYHLIGTQGTDDAFVVTPTSTWGDEATKDYKVITYPQRPFFNGLNSTVANTMESRHFYLGGTRVENLILEAISTSAYLQIGFK